MTKKDKMQRQDAKTIACDNVMGNVGMWEVVARRIERKRYVGRGCQNKL